MDKAKFRILSKIGLIFVFIGFFMPISCNLNGFQIAKTLETLGGPNLLSISLYIIFIFSCIGLFLLILLLMKINFNIKYDWIITFTIIAAFVFFAFVHIKDQAESIFSLFFQFQSGAYIIFSGIIIALISLLCISYSKDKKTSPNINFSEDIISNTIEEQTVTQYNEEDQENSISNDKGEQDIMKEAEQTNELGDVEKYILMLAEKKSILTVEYILDNSNFKLDVVERALYSLFTPSVYEKPEETTAASRLVPLIDIFMPGSKKITVSIGEHFYYFYTDNLDVLDADFVSLIKSYDLSKLKKLYQKITFKDEYESELYIGKIYYLYINKLGTEKEWNKKALKLKKLIEKILFGEKILIWSTLSSLLLVLVLSLILAFLDFSIVVILLISFGPLLLSIICYIIYRLIANQMMRKNIYR